MVDVIAAIGRKIQSAHNIIVITHVNPDGDALGSMTAVGLLARQWGKNVTLAVDDGIPERFRYLAMANAVIAEVPKSTDFDLLIAVDCGDLDRLGNSYSDLPKPISIINIDHHVTNTYFGELNLVPATTSSTAEVLVELFAELNVEITADIAKSLLTGMVTDTLGFRTSNVTPRTLKIAGDLMAAGANLPSITMQALNLRDYSTIQLWRVGLNNLQLEAGLAWSSISFDQKQSVGHDGTGNGGLVSMIANIKEAAMATVLVESEPNVIRVGLRSRPPYDVSQIAIELGGGGHPQASGCTLRMDLESAETLVVARCQAVIKQQSA